AVNLGSFPGIRSAARPDAERQSKTSVGSYLGSQQDNLLRPQIEEDDIAMTLRLKHLLLLALVLGILAASLPVHARPVSNAQAAQHPFYKRLGGFDALVAVTDEFITRLATDPKEGRFFVGLSTDSKTRVRQHVVDFLCVATGGPCKYTGRDMVTV